jgi:hypothetical protein
MKRRRRNIENSDLEEQVVTEMPPKRKRRKKRKPLLEKPKPKKIISRKRRSVKTPLLTEDDVVLADLQTKDVKLTKRKRTRWHPDFLRTIYHMALLGAKETEICDALNVHSTALTIWKRTRPAVVEALREGKMKADAKMAESFYHAGIGYSHPEVKIVPYKVKTFNEKGRVISEVTKIKRVRVTKHYPPNVTAGAKWLKARHPELWGDNNDETNTKIFNINTINFNELSNQELAVLMKLGFQQGEVKLPAAVGNIETVDAEIITEDEE